MKYPLKIKLNNYNYSNDLGIVLEGRHTKEMISIGYYGRSLLLMVIFMTV